MNSVKYLLDTSALMTFIAQEAGAERIETILRDGNVILTWVSLLEIHYITLQKWGQEEADRRYAILKRVGATIITEMDEPTLLMASKFKAGYQISFADAVIAAIAQQHQAVLVHKDPEFETLADEVALETLPYKVA